MYKINRWVASQQALLYSSFSWTLMDPRFWAQSGFSSDLPVSFNSLFLSIGSLSSKCATCSLSLGFVTSCSSTFLMQVSDGSRAVISWKAQEVTAEHSSFSVTIETSSSFFLLERRSFRNLAYLGICERASTKGMLMCNCLKRCKNLPN